MNARDRLNQLLASVGRFNLRLNDRDSCQVKLANGMTCMIELIPSTEHIFAYVPLSRLPLAEAPRAALLQEALTLNLYLQKFDVLALVYDKRTDHIVLCSQRDVWEPSEEQFDHWLGNLLRESTGIRDKMVVAGLQSSLARANEERRLARVARQERRQQQRKDNSAGDAQPNGQALPENPLQTAISQIHLYRI